MSNGRSRGFLCLPLFVALYATCWSEAPWLVVDGEDMTITSADSPVEVSGVSIHEATLTLGPGAELIFSGEEYSPLEIYHGRLVAMGTREEPARIRLNVDYDFYISGEQGQWDLITLHYTILDVNDSSIHLDLHRLWDSNRSQMVTKNCLVWGGEYTPPSWTHRNGMIVGGHRMEFTDTVFVSPQRTAIFSGAIGGSWRFDRCVFLGGHPTEGAFGINLYESNQTTVRIKDCRFDGFSYAISVKDVWAVPGNYDTLDISGSDFSGSAHLLWATGASGPFIANIRDSHLETSVLNNPGDMDIRFDLERCFIEIGTPMSNAPKVHHVVQPLTESPFHHVSFDADVFATHEDVRILAEVVAGVIESTSVPNHEQLDIDGDGEITMNDLGLLRAYVEGNLLFLPKVP